MAFLASFRSWIFSRLFAVHDPVDGRKISHAGLQVAQWGIQKKGISQACLVRVSLFSMGVPLCNLLSSKADFVSCDRVMQRAYFYI